MNKTGSTALITGASSGIGAAYAERLAHRGYNLVLVARDRRRLETRATHIRGQTMVAVEVLPADLTTSDGLSDIEARLRDDERIDLLVNNAGAIGVDALEKPDLDEVDRIIRLNVTAVTRLACAVIPRFLAGSNKAIVNVASAVALIPEVRLGIYGATKAYVLSFSQILQAQLGPQGLYVQVVLPSATRTEIWERSGRDIGSLRVVMAVEELVDAALVGFDRRELVTLPSLPALEQWEAFQSARVALSRNLGQEHAAARYKG
jgi:uncharacterized protein